MLGKAVPNFTLASTGRGSSSGTFTHSELRGETLVPYIFYLKEKIRFPFELLADPGEAVCKQLGVLKLKTRYGKKVRGITRSRSRSRGALALEWRGVKVPGHAQEVLNFAKAL